MYTITVDYYTVPLLSQYHSSTLVTWILIVLTKLIKDNLNWDWKNWQRRQRMYFRWT